MNRCLWCNYFAASQTEPQDSVKKYTNIQDGLGAMQDLESVEAFMNVTTAVEQFQYGMSSTPYLQQMTTHAI